MVRVINKDGSMSAPIGYGNSSITGGTYGGMPVMPAYQTWLTSKQVNANSLTGKPGTFSSSAKVSTGVPSGKLKIGTKSVGFPNLSSIKQAPGSKQTLPEYLTLQNQLNTQGLEALRNEALRSGPSAWALLQNQQQALEEQNLLNQAQEQGQAQLAQARSNLAMRGGLTGGAAERIARGSNNNLMAQMQNVRNQGAGNRLNIATQDEQKRIDTLKVLPTLEEQAAQYGTKVQDTNIARNIEELNRIQAQKFMGWQEQMKAWAASKQAAATAASKPDSKGFLGTGISFG